MSNHDTRMDWLYERACFHSGSNIATLKMCLYLDMFKFCILFNDSNKESRFRNNGSKDGVTGARV